MKEIVYKRVKLYWAAIAFFVLLLIIHWFRFDQNSFDTYYTWTTTYFIGTLMITTFFYLLYVVLNKVLLARNLFSSGFPFYANYIFTLLLIIVLSVMVNYVTNLTVNYLDFNEEVPQSLIRNADIIPRGVFTLINYGCLLVILLQVPMIFGFTLQLLINRGK